MLVPPDVPLYRTRAERFDDLVLQAVARLEPQWEAHLSGIEFAVEEIPPADSPVNGPHGLVPLSRLELGTAPGGPGGQGSVSRPSPARRNRRTTRPARSRRASWCTGGR